MPTFRLTGEQRLQVEWRIDADSAEEAERWVVENNEAPFNIVDCLETEVWDDPVEEKP